MNELLRNPDSVVEVLKSETYGLVESEVRWADTRMVILWLTLEPWAPMVLEDYPTEVVAITVWVDGRCAAVPCNANGRTWLHRNLFVLGSIVAIGDLCLWHVRDPRGLRWAWSDGFAAYVTIVHRHLMAEEFNRRHGHWPVEDAPHGDSVSPIRTPEMRRAALLEAS